MTEKKKKDYKKPKLSKKGSLKKNLVMAPIKTLPALEPI
jgi:hypothetical protein